MTRNLSFFFKPESVAVVGASDTKGKVGYSVMNNIISSNFKGEIYPINPNSEEIFNIKAYKTVLDVPNSIDIVVVCIPARYVVKTTEECAKKNVKGMIIITAGFKEIGGEGTELENKILEIAQNNNIKIIGPNCLGIISPYINATFASESPKKGSIAMISQSGAMMTAILDWSETQNLGFSNFVSIGNKADLDEVDFIEDFAEDPETKIIILYIESVNDGNKFLKVVPKATKKKPVIILKSGTSEAGSRAASSHTGALAGNDISFDIAFEKCGVIRAKTMTDLFDMARIFSNSSLPKGKNYAIITNAGGPGIVATDAFENNGLGLTHFSGNIAEELRKNLPPEAAIYNPVDIIGDATPERYKTALEIVFKEPDDICAGVLVLVTPQAQTQPTKVAELLIDIQKNYPNKVIIGSFMGGVTMDDPSEILSKSGIPVYPFPEQAIKSLKYMDYYLELQKQPDINTIKVPRFRFSTDRIKEIFNQVRSDNRAVLLSHETSEIFRLYGIKNPKTMLSKSTSQAIEMSKKIGFPLVMKIVSPDIIHKSDVGGVMLNINSEEETKDAFLRIINNANKYGPPNAQINGVEMQEMVDTSQYKKNTQLIIGMSKDSNFGPLLMVGMGGIYANYFKDVAFDLSYKYTKEDALEQLNKTKIYSILKGVRGEPRSDIKAVVDVLLKLSQLVNDFPDIVELDINPLLVFEETEEHDNYSAVDIKITISKDTVHENSKE